MEAWLIAKAMFAGVGFAGVIIAFNLLSASLWAKATRAPNSLGAVGLVTLWLVALATSCAAIVLICLVWWYHPGMSGAEVSVFVIASIAILAVGARYGLLRRISKSPALR